MIRVERVYDTAGDGNPSSRARHHRFLVERLWPRGIKKENLPMEAWLKDAAPSQGLRKWFSHDPAKWEEFQRRYRRELDDHPEAWQPLLEAARKGDVILLYSAKDIEHNNAIALKEYLQKHLS